MKSKLLSLFAFGIFAIVFLMGIGSAVTSSVFNISNLDSPSSVSEDVGSFTFTFTLNYHGGSESATISFVDSTSSIGNITIPSETGLNGSIDGGDQRVVTGTINNFANSGGQTLTAVINATGPGSSRDDETTFSVNITPVSTTPEPENLFCRADSSDKDLELEVTVRNRGEGRTDEWQPLDRIEVQVRLSNDLDDELRDVIFRIGLFEKGTTRNIIEDMIWISLDEDEYDAGDLREGRSSSRYTFEFRVNPEEIRMDRVYELKVKAFPDRDEGINCVERSAGLTEDGLGDSEYFGEITFIGESSRNRMVVIDDHKLQSQLITAQCGQDVTLFADVYNIGREGSASEFEDRIRVTLFNQELGINTEDVIFGDFFSGDKTTAALSFRIPNNAEEKTYTLLMRTQYRYNEDSGLYRETSTKTFNAHLAVSGCATMKDLTTVSAVLDSEAVAGKLLRVKATILNLDSDSNIYTVSASGYESWANSVTVSTPTLFLGGVESQDVVFTFEVRPDAEGTQSFVIEIVSDGEVLSQTVQVDIEPKRFPGITGFTINNDNAYLWGIGFLNLILVLVIIFVAVRIVRRRKSPEF